jgi:hypothetical protein
MEIEMTNRHNRQIAALFVLSTLSACAPPTDCVDASDCEEAANINDYQERGLEPDLEDGIDQLERSNEHVRIVELSRQDQILPQTTEVEPSGSDLRALLFKQIRTQALAEPCDVRGAVIGRFVQGTFQGRAFQDGEMLTAMFRGEYAAVPKRLGGLFEGVYSDLEGTDGTLMGSYLAPGQHKAGPFGTFHGNWGQSTQTDEAVEGNLAGVWLGQNQPKGGVFIGYWSVCDDAGWTEEPEQPGENVDPNEDPDEEPNGAQNGDPNGAPNGNLNGNPNNG